MDLDVQDNYAGTWRDAIGLGSKLSVIENEYSWTAIKWHEGRHIPLACCGIGMENAETWGFLAKDLHGHHLEITRTVKFMLDAYVQNEGRHVVALIDRTYEPAVRWAKLLKFRPVDDDNWIYQGSLRPN